MPQFRAALKNPTFTVYAYIGKESDKGWSVAQAAFKLVPALRVYLAPQRTLLKDWCDDPTARAVVWGFGPTPKSSLLRAEVNDLFAVIDAITKARAG
jgi:hypothetical protein